MGWYLLGVVVFFLADQVSSAIGRIPGRPVASLAYALLWPLSFPAAMVMTALLQRRRQDDERAPTKLSSAR